MCGMKRGGEEEGRKGSYSTERDRKTESNSLESKQSCHRNKYSWPEIQQQYTAGRDCGTDPA